MHSTSFVSRLTTFSALLFCGSPPLMAGGFERDRHDLELLFRDGALLDTEYRSASPRRSLENVAPLPGSPEAGRPADAAVSFGKDYGFGRVGGKIALGPAGACLVTYRETYGVVLDYGTEWVGRTDKTRFDLSSDSSALTCSYRFMPMAASGWRILGGVVNERIEVEQESVSGFSVSNPARPVLARLRLSDRATGWRLGAAWELPAKGMLASLTYASAVSHSYTGTLGLPERLTQTGVEPARNFDVESRVDSPQALQLDLRTGLPFGALASATLRWVDWSTLGIIPVTTRTADQGVPAGTRVAALEAAFRDGYSVDLGMLYPLDKPLQMLVGLGWDRGTATGLNPYTELWRASLGGRYRLGKAGHLGVTASYLRTGSGRIDPPPGLRVNYTANVPSGSLTVLSARLTFEF